MKPPRPNPDPETRPKTPFTFFPPRNIDVQAEGRDPHALIKEDPLATRFPTERHLGLFLWAASFLLYLASMSWAAFPGLPTESILMHMRRAIEPSALDSTWGWAVKITPWLPGLSVAAWMGLFSAVCGSLSVALMGRLMIRVGYLIRNEPGPNAFTREAQARRLSGLVAGLYLAFSIPFWVASTRSLPATFHVLLLLLAAWLFSQYQHWGKRRHLALLGLIYGIGITEFATFIVFAPLAIFLVAREMFRWQVWRNWIPQLIFWSSLLLGLSMYALHSYLFYRRLIWLDPQFTMGAAFFRILQEQFQLIAKVRFHPGFLVIMFYCLVPWLTLFAMSRRSPWFYEGGQVLVRLIFIGGLIGILFNATFAPWHLLGMNYLMVTPYLLLAVAMGYMAGEFWILGEPQPLVDIFWYVRWGRRAAGVLALLLPVIVLAGGFINWSTVDGRHGRVVQNAANKILDRLEGRDILFSTGIFDDTLRLLVRERRLPLRLVSAPRTMSPLYLRQLARTFKEEELRVPLWQGDFGLFLDNLLMSDSGVDRAAIIDMPDVFREYGYLVPDGFFYRLETSADALDLPALIESQRPFWAEMEYMAAHLASESNLARRYQDLLGLLASKVANNLGVMLAEHGQLEDALEAFHSARQLHSDNISVLMNLLELARTQELPEALGLEEDWDRMQHELEGKRWSLAIRYGYVWNAPEWVRRGWVWALSGSPVSVEAARRKPPPVEDETEGRSHILDQVYLRWGAPVQSENKYRAMLIRDERDTYALMQLCRLALQRNDPDAAEAYMVEALRMGLSEKELLFDRAMTAYVRGDRETALATLNDLSRETPGDPRVWLALALMTEPDDPVNELAIRTLKNHRAADPQVRLVLASLFMSRQEWPEAQYELEKVVQMDSSGKQAWEMMVTIARELGNRKLMESSLRALLARDPEHYLQYQNQGVAHYQQGNMEEAENAFRKGVQRRRDATLMNNLADVIMKRRGDLYEALDLINEAMRRQPGLGELFITRGEIYQAMGRYAEARDDFLAALRKLGRNDSVLLRLAQSYEKLGDRQQALKATNALAEQKDQLPPLQQRQLEKLQSQLR